MIRRNGCFGKHILKSAGGMIRRNGWAVLRPHDFISHDFDSKVHILPKHASEIINVQKMMKNYSLRANYSR